MSIDVSSGACRRDEPDLRVNLGGIRLAYPVVMASGTCGYGFEYEDFIDPAGVGAVIVKGTTRHPRSGNPPPRIVETPSGMLNAIGLENPGIEAFLRHHLPRLIDRGVTVIANIAGTTVDEYAEMAAMIDCACNAHLRTNHGCSSGMGGDSRSPGIAGIEINVSCPNVKEGGMHFGTDPDLLYEVVSAVKGSTRLPVMPKLSPNVGDIVSLATAAQAAGADALSMINTLVGMAVDIDTRRPVLGNIVGGLSGPAIKPVALRMIYEVHKKVDLPILGGGGIACVRDALEFLMVGASAVSIGTGTFTVPTLAADVIAGIRDYLAAHDMSSVSQIVGAAVCE